jgi:hypothetical protein
LHSGLNFMKTPRWTIEHALFGLAFLLALGVRFLNLGAAPLSDTEASWALQSVKIANGGQPALGPNPGYVMITSLPFFLLGSSNGLARFWPALAGALLVLLPAFFRKPMGSSAALILAFALALDPGLVAVSRSAGGGMPALAFGLLALGAAYQRRAILAGILGGLALLGGPALLTGMVGLALAWGAAFLLGKAGVMGKLPASWEQIASEISPENEQETIAIVPIYRTYIRTGLYFLLGTAVLLGTLFFLFLQGLAALSGSLTAYLRGWVEPSGIPALQLPAALLIYEPLQLILGVAGAVRSWSKKMLPFQFGRWLSLWALAALLVPMLYPARQVSDLIWVLIPLWGLAALELAHDLAMEVEKQNRMIVAGQTVLLLVLMVFAWNYLMVLSNANLLSGPAAWRNLLILVGGAAGMIVITTLLVSMGWSWPVARYGLVLGVSLALGFYMLSGMWGVSQVRPGSALELWSPIPAYGETDLFVKTISALSVQHTGQDKTLDAIVLADSSSLRWALRNWPNVRFTTNLSPKDVPSAIVAYQGQEPPSLAASYRGQDFPWESTPAWPGILPPDVSRWLTFRTAPLQSNEVILWARTDLFPDGAVKLQTQNPTSSEESQP